MGECSKCGMPIPFGKCLSEVDCITRQRDALRAEIARLKELLYDLAGAEGDPLINAHSVIATSELDALRAEAEAKDAEWKRAREDWKILDFDGNAEFGEDTYMNLVVRLAAAHRLRQFFGGGEGRNCD